MPKTARLPDALGAIQVGPLGLHQPGDEAVQLLLLHLLVSLDPHRAHPVVVPLVAMAMPLMAIAMVLVALVALVAIAMLVTVAVAVAVLRQLLLQALAHIHQHLLEAEGLPAML